jgi:hypothetical protein
MTPDDFRRLALAKQDSVEGAHQGHADFRVNGRVFATLGYPREGYAMVKLAPEQQQLLLEAAPGAFAPANGAWGRRGATLVQLAGADLHLVETALAMAMKGAAVRRARK